MLKPKAPLSKGSWLAVGKTEGIDQDKLTTKKNICVPSYLGLRCHTFLLPTSAEFKNEQNKRVKCYVYRCYYPNRKRRAVDRRIHHIKGIPVIKHAHQKRAVCKVTCKPKENTVPLLVGKLKIAEHKHQHYNYRRARVMHHAEDRRRIQK